MKIYISLPIETKGFNIPTQRKKAKATQLKLEAECHEVINPFDIYDRLAIFGVPKRREVMNADIDELLKCDAIYLCNGWTLSDGCIEEAWVATKSGITKLYENIVYSKSSIYDKLVALLAATHRLSLDRAKISQQIVELYLQNQNK